MKISGTSAHIELIILTVLLTAILVMNIQMQFKKKKKKKENVATGFLTQDIIFKIRMIMVCWVFIHRSEDQLRWC